MTTSSCNSCGKGVPMFDETFDGEKYVCSFCNHENVVIKEKYIDPYDTIGAMLEMNKTSSRQHVFH